MKIYEITCHSVGRPSSYNVKDRMHAGILQANQVIIPETADRGCAYAELLHSGAAWLSQQFTMACCALLRYPLKSTAFLLLCAFCFYF